MDAIYGTGISCNILFPLNGGTNVARANWGDITCVCRTQSIFGHLDQTQGAAHRGNYPGYTGDRSPCKRSRSGAASHRPAAQPAAVKDIARIRVRPIDDRFVFVMTCLSRLAWPGSGRSRAKAGQLIKTWFFVFVPLIGRAA